MSKKHFFLFMLSAAGSSALFAQSSDTSGRRLDEVVVTATKFPVKQSLTGKVLTVITKEQLEKSAGKQLTEVLNTQAGVFVAGSQGPLGSTQTVFLQGASGGKTLILIDGIPAYDPSGIATSFDLNLINTDQVERVEILKGSQSTLYGSDAVAGVINIITRKGGNKPVNLSAHLSGGSYGTFKGSAGIDGKIKNTSYNVMYTHLRSDGISSAYDSSHKSHYDNDGFSENLVMVNVGQKISDALNLRGNFQYNQYDNDLDAGGYKDDKLYTTTNKNTQAGIGADYTILHSAVHFNYNYNTVTRSYLDDSATLITQGGSFSKSKFTGTSHYLELYTNIGISRHLDLLGGVDYRNQRINETSLYISQYYAPPLSVLSPDSAKVRQFAAYVSAIVKNMGGFNFEVGGRYNSFNRYGDVFTYSINPSYLINSRVKIFANLSSGFSAPTLYQLYSEYRNPSGDLKPERTTSVETGIQYNFSPFNIRALYFHRNTRDNIIFYTDANYTSWYMNLNKQQDQGAELEASYRIDRWSFSGNYTYTTGKVTTPVNGKDTTYNNLYRRPKNAVNLSAGFQATSKLFLSTALRTTGKRIESVFGGAPVNIDSYYTLDAYAEYKVTSFLKVFADGKNLTNQQFFDIPGYSTKKFNFMAGVSLRW
ncbi:TonB-dependent receptor [Flavitalea sp. BT771]|uniref:TonB-dependent receptor plug domain-containing protein n=1 Tax=Flavitalea sp. BT771 TaxID=3063329 RepID=UPI0026E226E5|nr:TonB-dependent receptor [Flavitalea sp. BT771]MDO6434098.1 TonB-dependent receptor [Flavitalea sp. BT771]MDV6222998.1 TonB-dependent receptor [Flavitalea sp. BT771]